MDTPTPHKTVAWLALYAAVCVGAFVVGSGLRDVSPEPQPETPDTAPSARKAETTQIEHSPLPGLDFESAISTLIKTTATDEQFQTHYVALYLADRVDTNTLVALITRAGQIKGQEASIVRLILAIELADRDPDRIAKLLNAPGIVEKAKLNVSFLFQYWAKAEPAEAIACAAKLKGESRDRALMGLAGSGNADAAKFAESAASQVDVSDRAAAMNEAQLAIASKSWKAAPDDFSTLFRNAYLHDPAAGLQAAIAIDDAKLRNSLAATMLRGDWPSLTHAAQTFLAIADEGLVTKPHTKLNLLADLINQSEASSVADTLDWLSSALPPSEQIALLSNLGRGGDANTALEVLHSALFRDAPDSPTKNRVVLEVVSRLASENIESAMAYAMNELQPPLRDESLGMILRVAASDGSTGLATDLFSAIDSKYVREIAIQSMAGYWGRQHPLEFMEWATSHSDITILNTAIGSIANEWVERDIDSALVFATSLPENATNNSLYIAIGNKLAASDPWTATEFANTILDPTLSRSIVLSAMETLALTDPHIAVEFVMDAYAEDPNLGSMLSQISRNWAESNPLEVVEYFASLPNKTVALDGLGYGITRWLYQDYKGAVAYINTVPDSERRDRLYSQVTNDYSLVRNDPQAARELVARISDPDLREAAANQVEQILQPFDFLNRW